MRILVLQHNRIEHAGIFRQFLSEDGHDWLPVLLDEGENLPPLDGFDALWVMGGTMDAWEEVRYPWLRGEIELISEAVEKRGMPFLGLCLGHQLLATALGGQCAKSKQPEIGVFSVQLTEDGATGIIFDDIPDVFQCLQWHSSEVTKMPTGAACLATSPTCSVQAMSWGPRAYSMQFHLEVDPEIVANWTAIPDHKLLLETAHGENGKSVLQSSCDDQMASFNNMAERVYINWLQATAQV